MAAPPSKTMKDLTGKWVMNKTLSDSTDPGLALQGIGWLTRKAIGLSTVTLHVKQYTGPPNPPSESKEDAVHVDIAQTATGGVKGTTENRCADSVEREHTDWLFGTVRAKSYWAGPDAIKDDYLRGNWEEGEAERAGPAGETHLVSYAESVGNGWVAIQVWGFQVINDERRYARNVTIEKNGEKVEFRLVYDWAGLEDE